MRWYEYKMEADDLHAPEDLKAKLLAMADTLPEEEKNRPMMPAQADNTAVVRPQEPPKKAKLIHFPAKPVGALAATTSTTGQAPASQTASCCRPFTKLDQPCAKAAPTLPRKLSSVGV